MKFKQTLGLTTAGLVWLATVATAQRVTTNPTAVPNTVSTPTFQPDTLRPSREQMLNDETAGQTDADRKNRRERRKNMRRNNRDENSRMNRTGSTSGSPQTTNPQDGAYRQGAMSNGTTNNNSNTTNYNSNSVMTAPSGVGSNPSATGAAGDVRPGTAQPGTVESGSTAPAGTATNSPSSTGSPNLNRPGTTGTGEAVAGAENAPVVNTSVSVGKTTVGDFVAAQPDYTTLQNALQSIKLDEALKDGQSYTVFAPSNAAFKKLPAKTQNVLLEGQNRDALKKLLSYHVVQGTVDAKELAKQINAGNGTAQLKTLSGNTLTAKMGSDGRVMVMDEQGNTAYVDTPNKVQTNGVVHGIDKVLMPKDGSVTFR